MENFYLAHRLLEDFGIGKVCRTDYEFTYQKIKSRSDLTLRLARIDMNFPIENLEAYVKSNWTTIKETENLQVTCNLVTRDQVTRDLVTRDQVTRDLVTRDQVTRDLVFEIINLNSQVDQGGEFYNTLTLTMFHSYGIQYFSVYSDTKNAIVERYIS